MIKVMDGFIDSRILEFEPEARMPLSEAYPMFGFEGDLIKVMATDEYTIHMIEEKNGKFVVAAGDRITHELDGDTMVYVKFSDLMHDRAKLAERSQKIMDAMYEYGMF